MKYLLLPLHLIKFWYPEALQTFLLTWRNTISYLEEDLAVTLMIKLIMVPLFHDSTIIGRVLSVIFRLLRIALGLFAFAFASVVIVGVALIWFGLPILLFIKPFSLIAGILIFCGVGSFAIHVFTHPHKKTWQIHQDIENNLWLVSTVKQKDVIYENLLKEYEVQLLIKYVEALPENFQNLKISNVSEVALEAFNLAKAGLSPYLTPSHFFVAAVKKSPGIDDYLMQFDLEVQDLELALLYLEKRELVWRVHYPWDDDFAIHHLKGVNRGWIGAPTPLLDSISFDVTRIAATKMFPDFIGRDSDVKQVLNILANSKGANVILVAPAGSGKTALINYLAKQIISGDAPPTLATKRVVSIDFPQLLSGITSQGDLAERIKIVFDEISYSQNVILIIEEIHNLGIGEAGAMFNLYSLLLPYIESSNFQFVATTEPENYSRIIERNSSFARLFTKVELSKATVPDTIQILEDLAIDAERHGKLRVSFKSVKKTAKLASELIHDRVLPDSAIAIFENAVTKAVSARQEWLTSKDIEEVTSQFVNVPVTELKEENKAELLHLEDEIHETFIDQEEAVKGIADTLRRSATGLREKNRPIGSFLFVGPTGVGKTELAKTLAEKFFKKQGVFFRLDMSEYQTPMSVENLIGGHDQEGILTEFVRKKPYCLILLDEFEKANPQILTLFLQVLEDGRLTDGRGTTVDFTNTIIIATSNAGSLLIVEGMEKGIELQTLEHAITEELLLVFRPELLNRFDKLVLFKPLAQQFLEKIVTGKLADLQAKLKEQGYNIDFDQALIAELAEKGYDPVLGARPLRRLLQDTVEANLSKLILGSKLKKGEHYSGGTELLEEVLG